MRRDAPPGSSDTQTRKVVSSSLFVRSFSEWESGILASIVKEMSKRCTPAAPIFIFGFTVPIRPGSPRGTVHSNARAARQFLTNQKITPQGRVSNNPFARETIQEAKRGCEDLRCLSNRNISRQADIKKARQSFLV